VPARPPLRGGRLCITEIGDRCETPPFLQREPGSTGLQVATADDIGFVRPPVCVLRWSRMKLIAIGRENQRVVWVLPEAQHNEAHNQLSLMKWSTSRLAIDMLKGNPTLPAFS